MSTLELGPTKEDLENQKLALEIRLLRQQKHWELWKSLTAVAVPVLTFLALVGGGWKYFHDERTKLRLRMEDVYSASIKDLASPNPFVRTGAVTTLLSYARLDRSFDERAIAVLALAATEDSSVIVRQTIVGNFSKLNQIDKSLFQNFQASVDSELQKVSDGLGHVVIESERARLEDQRKTLLRVKELLSTIPK